MEPLWKIVWRFLRNIKIQLLECEWFYSLQGLFGVSQLVLKNPQDNAGDVGSIPGVEGGPPERNGNPFLYSCLENPMDRGAWWATDHSVAKSQT